MTKKIFWRIASIVLAMSIVLSFALISVTADVPDIAKTDYAPAGDGNLIDMYPEHGVDINAGEVPCSVSGTMVTLAANDAISADSNWGMKGFHINQRFISQVAPAAGNESQCQAPVFPQETKVLLAAKVRKTADATADAKINVAYSSWYSASYEGWSPKYTDTYPTAGDGFLVNSTDWMDFKAVITVPARTDGNTWGYTIGLASGTEAGAKVEIDMTSMYLGAEMAYDIEASATPASLSAGSSTTVTATIVNQMGDKFSGTQGGFSWYALTGDREAFAEGIEVADNGDGTATVSVADSALAGKYDIVAVSDTYEGFVKGASITVTNLKYDYVPGDDGNLIDMYPEHGVDINAGEVPCSVSGTMVTLAANDAISADSNWGMKGFHINQRFISSIIPAEGNNQNQAPVFPQETKVLLAAKVRKTADATADAKINVAYSSWYSASYEGWSPKYTDTYPTAGDGFLVNSTDWMDFKAVITVPARTDGNTWGYTIGLASGTEAGAKVEIDMTSMYLGAEMAYDIKVTADSTKAEAKIVNQIGEKFSGAQGGFSWIAMNADKTAEVDGIEVTDNGDGTANVSVADSVAAGKYAIVAVSDTYDGFVKGAEIEVTNIKNDYVPADDGNLIDTYPQHAVDINSGEVGCAVSGSTVTLTANSTTGTSTEWGMQGFEINERFISSLTDGVAPVFPEETKVLISAKVRKAADATADAKLNVSYSSWYAAAYEGWSPKYTDTYPNVGDGFVVNSTEWTDFKAVITVPARDDGNTWAYLLGLASGTEAGAKVEIDMSSMYFGSEEIYDITNKAVGSSAVVAGVDSTVTYKAQIVNQIGITSDIPQGTFKWFVMNEDKTAAVDGIEVIANADNTATINVSKTVPVGTYMVIAKSNLYPDYIKSSPLVVAGEDVKYTIYVSPEGNDSNIGALAAPLKTVQAAQILARQYVAEGKLPLEVVFRGGDYYFEESLAFGASDSGENGRNVTYRAYENEEVKFKGSKQIDLSKAAKVTDSDILARIRDEVKKDVRVIDLAEQGITAEQICTPASTPTIYKLDFNREFNGFYINGESMDVASWPNGDDEATYTFDENDSANKFTYTDAAPDRWGHANNWWVSIFNSYDYIPLRLKASSIDTANNVIYVGNDQSIANINNPYTPRWKAYNLLEEIDIAGEYYIDVENMKLYFLPGCDLEGATAEFEVIGDPVIKLQDAENITFKDIEFSQINDDGVVMTDVNNVDVLGCTFRDIGFRGLAVIGTEEPQTQPYAKDDKLPYGKALGEVPMANNASYNVDIKDNIFYNTGSSAIHINGGNIDTLTPSNNVVENNSISKFAQNSYWDGVVVAGVGTKVRKNNISDSPYYGIRIYGNDHVIEYNEIYDVIKNSNDAAAIYVGASAIARGSVIQYNYIHDIKTWKDTKNDWEVGIYLDDCQQGITVKNNIIADVDEGIWSNGAGDYTIDANTIVNATTGIRFGYNEDADPSESVIADVANRIYNKDIYYAKYPALKDYVDGVSPKKSSKANANIFCNVATNMEYYRESWFTGNINTCIKSLSQDKDAQHAGNNTVTADVFVNPAAQDYRVNSDNVSSYYYSTNVENTPDINVIGMTTNLVLNAETSPFTVTNPVNGATKVPTNGVWLAWSDAFGASQYKVQVATDAAFNNTVYNEVVPCAAANISDSVALSADTTYYWKVTAINPSRDFGAEWSAEGSFTTAGTSIENMTLEGNTVTADIYTYGDVISGSVDAVCYIASYDENGKVLEIVPQEITLQAGTKYPFENSFENFVEDDTYSVKMYVWTEGCVPVADDITINIPKEEQ